MAGKPTRNDPAAPWQVLIEFPTYADAAAARDLLSPILSETIIVRPKQPYSSADNVGSWELTARLRIAFGNLPFDAEAVRNAMLVIGYTGTKRAVRGWLNKAFSAKVIERRAEGEYQFPAMGACLDAIASHQTPLSESLDV